MVSPEEWSDAAQDDISLDAVRRALATIHGSLSEPYLKSAESADCPDTSSTPALWPNSIVERLAVTL